MKIEVTQGGYKTAPEYKGIAKIVGETELKEYDNSRFGKEGSTKMKFQYIIEFPVECVEGKNFTISTKPMTPVMNQKSSLYKFYTEVTGKAPQGLVDTESLIGKYVDIKVVHVSVGDKTYANLKSCDKVIGKVEEFETTWKPKDTVSEDQLAEYEQMCK